MYTLLGLMVLLALSVAAAAVDAVAGGCCLFLLLPGLLLGWMPSGLLSTNSCCVAGCSWARGLFLVRLGCGL